MLKLIKICFTYNCEIVCFLSNKFAQNFIFCRMGDRTVDCEDGFNVEDLVIDENHSEKSAWKFRSSTTLPGSEVVFFPCC